MPIQAKEVPFSPNRNVQSKPICVLLSIKVRDHWSGASIHGLGQRLMTGASREGLDAVLSELALREDGAVKDLDGRI